MKIILPCLLIFLLQYSYCVDPQKKSYDLTDNEDHIFVVKLLFEKLTELLNKTTILDECLTTLNRSVAIMEENLNRFTESFVAFRRMQDLEYRINSINSRFVPINALSSRMQDFENRINSINSRFGSLDEQIKANKIQINQRMDEYLRSLIIPDSA
ncbi:uncharacterized protein LOC105261562 isoform X2 [Musca domestica]|uniref:Uncharacterized protein LOC105261562 isoform X2 n=1 Tax=Musca domestica TaxID=7370 RepID=A0A9J7IC40_MUSDO|nr:uncharacterized protein LOC105261562 isoform X2 [Musca domestica]